MCAPQRGSLPYQKLTVPEHSRPGTVVGNVTRAVDADEGANAVVYYFIAGDTLFNRHSSMLSNIAVHVRNVIQLFPATYMIYVNPPKVKRIKDKEFHSVFIQPVCLEPLVSFVWSDESLVYFKSFGIMRTFV